MSLVVAGLTAWVPCSVATALLVARGIWLVERAEHATPHDEVAARR